MRLVMYTRVSSRGQVDMYGLDTQREDCRRWCEAHGYEIIGEFTDEARRGTRGVDVVEGIGNGGENLAERPGLRDAIKMIQDGGADGLVCGRADRLGRATHVSEAVYAMIWRAGGRVFAADQGEVIQDDPSDPMRTAMRKMMGVFAELERGLAVARMKAGREAKAAAGKHAVGPYRYGTRGGGEGRDRDAVEDPDEAAVVARINELRAAGLSLRQVGAQLAAEGILPRSAQAWSASTIRKIAQRADGS